MIDKLAKITVRAPGEVLYPAAFLLLAGIGYIDYSTGYFARVSGLYLLPVFLVGLVGKKQGLVMAVAATLVGAMSDAFDKPRSVTDLIFLWNVFMNFFVYTVFVIVLSHFKNEFSLQTNQARRDQLTGLYNLTGFYELATAQLQKSRQLDQPLSLIYLDCDNFKNINDTRGHAAGDLLLQTIARTMTTVLRKPDLVFRWGGDEFVAVLPDTGQHGAKKAAEKLQPALMLAMEANGWPVTFSIGVAVFLQLPENLDDMLRKADGAMYQVKRAGKNAIRCEVFETNSPPPDGKKKRAEKK